MNMNDLDKLTGQFRDFDKDDFEADWTKLAEGKFGEVNRVKLKDLRTECALKRFDKNFYRKIIDEVPKLVNLRFKYIVSVYGLCSKVSAVVMEYMGNGSLNNRLSSYNLMWPKKFQMIHETTMGMNFLHSIQPPVVHLNLKTSNILLDEHLHVKISDFGLIKWEEHNKEAFMELLTAKGNISYTPPEAFTPLSAPPGTSFDVYSFGIVMWEILTQQKPYPGCSLTKVILQVSEGKRPCEKVIPDERPNECEHMMAIMKQCWEQDHRRRPHFSDIVKRTENLSDIMKLPESIKSDHPVEWKPPLMHMSGPPELFSENPNSSDAIVSLLFRKKYDSFRQTVRREHVSTRFSGKRSLLHFTVASGDLESVEHVLSLRAEVNCTTTNGYTPLIVAVMYRFRDIASLLLDHGAAVNQGDDDSWMPLHFAVQNGDDKCARLLLDKKAVVDAQENAGWTPLHLACQNNHEAVVRLLLSRNAAIELKEDQGRTPLHLACTPKHESIVKLLLSRGADPNATNNSLSTPLHLAAEGGENQIVRELVFKKANTNSADNKGHTPLHMAALMGHKGICRHLLQNGASQNPRTLQGWTPMHLAALKGDEMAVVLLESKGGDVNSRGQNEWTPLHVACHGSHEKVVEKLLAAKADPNLTEGIKAWTPLHFASYAASFSSVLQLLKYQANVNASSSTQVRPLHLAAQHGRLPIVQALLMNGADRTLQDSAGYTALHVAQRCEKWDIATELEKDS